MQIAEGYLPLGWCVVWLAVMAPFWRLGLGRVRVVAAGRPGGRALLGMAGAFAFVLGAVGLPGVAGASGHVVGAGLGAILLGPAATGVLGTVALLLQALLLGRGGLSTLGANALSAAVAGPLVAWVVWWALRGRAPAGLAAFLAAALASLAAALITALQLALAYPDPVGGVVAAFARFAALFALAQAPIALGEGALTALIVKGLRSGTAPELEAFGGVRWT
jgi:cobalt/nickel transport system permease protein